MSTTPRPRFVRPLAPIPFWLLGTLTGGLFVLDILLPLGVASGVPYLLVILLSLTHEDEKFSFRWAIGCSILCMIGILFSPPGATQSWDILINRVLGLFVIWVTTFMGHTLLRQAKAIEARENTIRGIMESIPTSCFTFDRHGTILSWNPGAERMYGYTKEEAIGESSDDLIVTPETAQETKRVIAELFQGTFHENMVWRDRNKAGDLGWRAGNIFPVFDENGQVAYGMNFNVDITKLKEAELAIQKNEERLQAIINNSPAVVFVKDLEGRYLLVNRQWEKRFSLSNMDVIGKTVHELFSKTTADALLANDQRVFDMQRPMEFEEVIPHDDGVHTYLSIKFPVPAFQEEPMAICGIATDITERKQTEGLLQAQNTILKLLACGESVSHVFETLCLLLEQQRPGTCCSILLVEPDGKTLRLGAAPSLPKEFADALDGLHIEEFNGSCGSAVFLGKQVIVHDVRDAPHTEGLRDFSLKHGIQACWSTPFFRRDGTVLGSFGVCHPAPCSPTRHDQQILDTGAHLTGIACERHATELALQQSEAKLRQAQKMEAIGTLAGGIAHDFNNILTAILGFNELARSFPPTANPINHYLEEVYAAGIRAKGLTEQILAFSRQSDQKLQPIDLRQITEEALRFLRATLPTTIEIRTTLAEHLPPIIADSVQIHQVLMNLCTNAAQAMEENGGVLEVGLESVRLTDEEMQKIILEVDERKESYLKLTIRDTGTGIPPDILDRIFDPFFSTKQAGDGTGLGLSVVHGIVSSHGGGITVDSALGEGTRFTIFLPEFRNASHPEPLKETPLTQGGKERILFVEDEESIALLGEEILGQLGYTVTVVTRSVKALELFQQRSEAFDLVITDQTMPNMTGEVLSQELLQIRPDIPIILCTGYSQKMTPERAKQIGIRAFLWKPYVIHDLSHTIHDVLSS